MRSSAHRSAAVTAAKSAVGLLITAVLGAAVLLDAAVLLAGCGGTGGQSARAPSPGTTATVMSSSGRGAALHEVAQCIRDHGLPSYPDPVLTASGQAYTDLQTFRLAPDQVANAIQQACGALMARAGFDPTSEPPAPAQLVRAGVRAAQCMRAHGLPNVSDPTAQTPYAPGHGFGFTGSELPAGDKFNPAFRHAAQACQAVLDAEDRASILQSLGTDG
jgi:hypothetical protein